MTMIVPTNLDVLCGKDRACLQAEGSRRFRDIIDSHVASYMKLKTKFEKMQATKRIYEEVSRDARFLKFNEKEQIWEEISVNAARDKVGHALRFSSRAKRRNNGNKKQQQQQNKAKRTHKRSGSWSSTSSEGSSSGSSTGTPVTSSPTTLTTPAPLAWESLIGQLRSETPELLEDNNDSSSHSSIASLEEEPAPVDEFFAETHNSLDDFLALELQYDTTLYNNNEAIQEEETTAEEEEDDPLNNFMDDMLKVVKNIEEEDEGEDSLLSLLSEPVGEWEEDYTDVDFS